MATPASNLEIRIDEPRRAPVRPDGYAIASGVNRENGRDRLRLTLKVTPDDAENLTPYPGQFSILDWPKEIHQGLRDGGPGFDQIAPDGEIALTFVKVGPCPDNRAPRPEDFISDTLVPKGVELLGSTAMKWQDLGELTRIWQASLMSKKAQEEEDSWQHLVDATTASLSGEGMRARHIADPNQDVELVGEDDFGKDGQLKPKEAEDAPQIDGIMAIPHADLALSLDQQRASELLISLQAACGDTDAHFRAEERRVAKLNATSRIVDAPDPLAGFSEPLLGEEQKQAARDEQRRAVKKQKIEERSDLQGRLQPNRQIAKERYLSAVEALKSGLCADLDPEGDAPQRPLTAQGAATDTSRETALEDACAAHLYASWPEYVANDDTPSAKSNNRTKPDIRGRRIVQAFGALQSDPVLSRLFGLAFDVEFDADEVLRKHPTGGYFFIGTGFEQQFNNAPKNDENLRGAEPRTWTLAKLARDAEGRWQFWPATEREMHAELNGRTTTVTQRDGLFVMGEACAGTPEDYCPRFDLTAIDIRTATESEMQRRISRQANYDAGEVAKRKADGLAKGTGQGNQWKDLGLGAKLLSGGLTLMSRTAQTDTAERLARREIRGGRVTEERVLDATDLTVGMRPLVGMPDTEGNVHWRGLTERDISYGTSGPDKGKVEPLIKRFFKGTERQAWRRRLEAAFVSSPNRLLPAGPDGREAVVDEAILVWDGDPMGVDCSMTRDASRATEEILSFGRTMTLPDSAADGIRRLHPLRFGWPYRFGLSVVYSGGATRPLAEIPNETDDPGSDDLFYPPGRRNQQKTRPFFRFLRHEKLAAPLVAMSYGYALRDVTLDLSNFEINEVLKRGHSKVGPMGAETGPRLVIRSVVPLDDGDNVVKDPLMSARNGPVITQRLVLPPNVPFDDAMRHGAFDKRKSSRIVGDFSYAAGARSNLGDKMGRENLVVTRTDVQRGIDGRSHMEKRSISDWPNAELASETTSLGDAVLTLHKRSFNNGNVPLDRYYVDPAADDIAVAVRRKGETDYLSGGPVLIPTVAHSSGPATRGHSDERIPLVVTLRESELLSRCCPTDVSEIATVSDFANPRRFNPSNPEDGFNTIYRDMKAHELTFRLAPGEAFEIDVWAVPSAERLAREFALVQSLGILLAERKKANGTQSLEEVIQEATEAVLPEAVVNALVFALEGSASDSWGYVGPGGVAAPSNESLRLIAKVIHDQLTCHPIPEISARSRMEVVHACNRVPARPSWPEGSATGAPDLDHIPASAAQRAVRAARPKALGTSLSDPLIVSAPNARTLVLDGAIPFDFNGNDAVEIVAKMVLPGSSAFDNRARGRSVLRRRAASWPQLKDSSGTPLLDKAAAKDAEDKSLYRSAEDIFGFQVAPNGRVRHQCGEVVLLRAEGLPVDADLLDLRALFEDCGPGTTRITHRHIFPDGKARRMTVWLNALSRSLEDMRTVDRVASSKDAWLAEKGGVFRKNEQIPAQDVPPEHQANTTPEGERLEVILPATIRPAKCDARAPLPVLAWDEDTLGKGPKRVFWKRRRATMRIPLGREWFSSGEDERLGLVVWPPVGEIPDLDGANHVVVPGRFPGDPDRKLDLEALDLKDLAFSDEDLGPGGKFICRRGADPIRGSTKGGSETDSVMYLADFPDLRRDEEDVAKAEFVQKVLMPVEDDQGEHEEAAPTLPPMQVSLIAYKPRFDVEREEWYVDVDLEPSTAPEGFVRFGLVRYQPHAVPALRCSAPVTQWAQPLPSRLITISQSDQKDVVLEISGHVSDRKRLPDKTAAASADRLLKPNMRLTLYREIKDDVRGVRREILPLKDTGTKGPDDWQSRLSTAGADEMRQIVVPNTFGGSDGTAIWKRCLDLTEIALDGGRILLLMEEIEAFRPASYPNEPLSDVAFSVWRDSFVEAGPRFSAEVDLTQFVDREVSSPPLPPK